MRRFREEKLEIKDCPSSIVIKAFGRGLLRSSNLFVKLTKVVTHIMEEAYDKVKNFVNLRKELKLGKKGKSFMEVSL